MSQGEASQELSIQAQKAEFFMVAIRITMFVAYAWFILVLPVSGWLWKVVLILLGWWGSLIAFQIHPALPEFSQEKQWAANPRMFEGNRMLWNALRFGARFVYWPIFVPKIFWLLVLSACAVVLYMVKYY